MNTENINRAKKLSLISGYVSISIIQRQLLIGYNEAKQLVEILLQQNFCEQNYTREHGYKVIAHKDNT
ncbi:DNA translocase FtsK [Acinetobacter bouvetii]|uniref:Ftsk gamma domain protein n=1 Tax=Acinetobacter bouvetii TaxID=202951 RepID=A0A811GB12_9GAMM|nr:DNA translocase FtsK [Acinetobacter bouvetii]CAB1212520.1 Ftsk gamma domain protein [Acinetobacter bouvetii]